MVEIERRSKVWHPNPGRPYLRVQIPKIIQDLLDLEEGDKMVWRTDPGEGCPPTIEVKKE